MPALKILQKKENPFLSRDELVAEIDFQGKTTPSGSQVKKDLAEQEKIEPSVIAMKGIRTEFGRGKAKVHAVIYKSSDHFKRYEPKEKKAEGADAKGQPAPAEKKE
ncbi:hypothetical protein HYU13_01385 [Candidatus Woesearchaeota archaeon]|nr:hypothetical protein [Candidatus Woesearchaeota archaeon]